MNFITVSNNEIEYEFPILNLDTKPFTIDTEKKIGKLEIYQLSEQNKQENQTAITREDIKIGEEQPQEIVDDLLHVLNSYRDCIATNMRELGCTNVVEMDIVEQPESVPVNSKPYKVSNHERQEIAKIVKEWKDEGIVQETQSPYASPVLLVKKKTGENRLVVDFRKLNKQTVKMNFPLPNIDDHIALLSESQLYITLDLAHGYLQVPLTKEARPKTAFITPDETGEFTRMVFGLMNAPFYFSKLMQTVLGPYRDKILLYYLDDILLPGKNWLDLKEKLIKVLTALRSAGLTITLNKCEFLKKKVSYLGFEVSEKGIEPGQKKVGAIVDYPIPKDVHELRRFLGMASFFRRFICHFAQKVRPLYDLLKKTNSFTWTSKEQTAFEEVKRILSNKPILQIYNPSYETHLHTDACSVGLAAMLFQKGPDDKMHLVYAISRRTSTTEMSYHSSKLELLVIVWAVERLRLFLIDKKFTIYTDCQALVYLNKNKTTNPQIIRWCNLLAEYDFDIKYRMGQAMRHVDALSRAPTEDAEVDFEKKALDKIGMYSIINREEEIVLYQRTDDCLKRKIDILRKSKEERTNEEKGEVKDYRLKNGLLYKVERKENEEKELYVVPKSMRKSILIKYHDLKGHFGTEKTMTKIREYFYFPKMKKYVDQHIKMCVECILSKNRTGRQAGYLNPIPPGKRPFEVIHTDYLGPFITSNKGNKYVLLMIDNLTKFVQLEPVKNTRADTTVKRMERFIERFGAPQRIISDRGTCYTAGSFQKFCDKYGIKHTLNSSRHPQANGLVERLNATILPLIQMSTEHIDGRDWDEHIKHIEREINTTENKTTGKTPFELLYGYIPRFDDGKIRELTKGNETYRLPTDLREEVRHRVEREQRKYKARYDKHRYKGLKYNVGDIVYMKSAPVATGDSTKLQSRYKGPLVVIEQLPSDTYRVTRLTDEERKHTTTAHVSQLKLWKNYEKEENEDEDSEKKEATSVENQEETSKRRPQVPGHLKDYVLS